MWPALPGSPILYIQPQSETELEHAEEIVTSPLARMLDAGASGGEQRITLVQAIARTDAERSVVARIHRVASDITAGEALVLLVAERLTTREWVVKVLSV